MGVRVDATVIDPQQLKCHGILTYTTLSEVVSVKERWLVERLLLEKGITICVGDSNIGKTPFSITVGLSVASGIPLFGRPTKPGTVLYCDHESSAELFHLQMETICRTLGLSSIPERFCIWPPHWIETKSASALQVQLMEKAAMVKPDLVIVDTLRSFWPGIEKDPEQVSRTYSAMKKNAPAWFLNHHVRKASQDPYSTSPDLLRDPHGWLQQTVGSYSLVNLADTRLGVERVKNTGTAELVVGGFARGTGPIPPIYLGRQYDPDTGEVLGYQQAVGVEFLNQKDREAYEALPGTFRNADVIRALGNSSSNAKRFTDNAITLGVLAAHGEGKSKRFTKVAP